jgi:hypothetical protein
MVGIAERGGRIGFIVFLTKQINNERKKTGKKVDAGKKECILRP